MTSRHTVLHSSYTLLKYPAKSVILGTQMASKMNPLARPPTMADARATHQLVVNELVKPWESRACWVHCVGVVKININTKMIGICLNMFGASRMLDVQNPIFASARAASPLSGISLHHLIISTNPRLVLKPSEFQAWSQLKIIIIVIGYLVHSHHLFKMGLSENKAPQTHG